MLVQCGIIPSREERARRQTTEGKLKESMCRDIFIQIQDTSGEVSHTSANFTTWIEILVALSVYMYAHQPHITLFRVVRRFIERNLLRGARECVAELHTFTTDSIVSHSKRELAETARGAKARRKH